MTRKIFLLTIAFISFSVLLAFSDKVANFSGTWYLDESASELGGFRTRGASTKIVIYQSNEAFKIILSTIGFDGNEEKITETHFVGKESQNTFVGNNKKVSTLNWLGDRRFQIDYKLIFEANGQNMVVRCNQKWEISADGKTLTLYSQISTPQEEISSKAVYRKG